MKTLLATVALATLGLTGAAQAGGYGYGYGHGGYVTYVERPVYRVVRPVVVRRVIVQRRHVPSYGVYFGY